MFGDADDIVFSVHCSFVAKLLVKRCELQVLIYLKQFTAMEILVLMGMGPITMCEISAKAGQQISGTLTCFYRTVMELYCSDRQIVIQ